MLTERLTALERDQGIYTTQKNSINTNDGHIPVTEASAHARFKEVESSQLMQQSLQEENSYLLGQVKQLVSGDVALHLVP